MVYPDWLQLAFPYPYTCRHGDLLVTDRMARKISAALTEHASKVKEVHLPIGSLSVDSPGTRALCQSIKLLRKLRFVSLTDQAQSIKNLHILGFISLTDHGQRRQQSRVAKALLSSVRPIGQITIELKHLHVDGTHFSHISRYVDLHLRLFHCSVYNLSAGLKEVESFGWLSDDDEPMLTLTGASRTGRLTSDQQMRVWARDRFIIDAVRPFVATSTRLTDLTLEVEPGLRFVDLLQLQTSHIRNLRLGCDTLDQEQVDALEEYLRNNEWLEVLALLRPGRVLPQLMFFLQSNHKLRKLELVQVPPLYGPDVRDFLLHNQQLPHLTIEGLAAYRNSSMVDTVFVGLRGNQTLKSLSLQGCFISDVSGIAGYLSENQSLTSLGISCRSLVTSGWENLRDVLVEREVPLDLNFRSNIGEGNLRTLVSALEANARVHSLVLDYSIETHSEALNGLFRTLRSNPHLSELTLRLHQIDYRPTLEALVEVIPFCCALRKLKVDENAEWQGWEHRLLDAMARNESLFELQLGSHYVARNDKYRQRSFQYYGLRNRVNLSMQSLPKILWPNIIARLCRWKDRSIGLSNLSLLLKMRPEILQHAGLHNKKKRHATEADRESI